MQASWTDLWRLDSGQVVSCVRSNKSASYTSNNITRCDTITGPPRLDIRRWGKYRLVDELCVWERTVSRQFMCVRFGVSKSTHNGHVYEWSCGVERKLETGGRTQIGQIATLSFSGTIQSHQRSCRTAQQSSSVRHHRQRQKLSPTYVNVRYHAANNTRHALQSS